MTKIDIHAGLRVKTLWGELDDDDEGQERHTPAGSWGIVAGHNHLDHWNVHFDNGAAVILTEDEMHDANQYMLQLQE